MSGKFGLASGKSQGILFCPVCMNPDLALTSFRIIMSNTWFSQALEYRQTWLSQASEYEQHLSLTISNTCLSLVSEYDQDLTLTSFRI